MEVWINGEYKSLDQVNVSPLSHSFSRGSSIFEVFDITKTSKGPAFFGLERHIDRLINSAELMYMPLPYKKEEILKACTDAARRNNVSEGVTKLYVYYPGIEMEVYPESLETHLAIFCFDFKTMGVESSTLSKPVNVGVSSYCKLHPKTMPIHAKICGTYVNGYLSMAEMKSKGYDGFINYNLEGSVSESGAASAFFVKDGILRTAKPEDVLLGITRAAILELAHDDKLSVLETDIKHSELPEMEEAFFAVSAKKIQPIRSIDGNILGEKCPGPVTSHLMDLLSSLYNGTHAKSGKWLLHI